MRLAAIYDIHGNLPALQAVLAEIRRIGVDQVVVGGDVLPGPMPREALDCLLSLDTPTKFILGNGDRVVLEQMAGVEPNEVPEPFRPSIRWNAQQLAPQHQRALSEWPRTVQLEVRGLGSVLFCHATPRNDTEIFTRETAESPIVPVLHGVTASIVVCGHTHMQFDRTVGGTRIVNAGSVGMPFGEPGAYWLLLGPGVGLRRSGYDLIAAARRIEETHYPQALEFATRNVLQPPTEASTLEAFAKLELK
jgi:predicted phosphodiesterase